MALARRTRSNTDIWPGFVDALATLLVVIIFLLMIFVVGQIYLNDALTGRDKALDKLNGQVSQLAEMLDMERLANTDLRSNIESISTELRSSLAKQDELDAIIAGLRDDKQGLDQQLLDAQDINDKVSADLEDAFKSIEASEEKLVIQLASLATLQHQIEALEALKTELRDELKEAQMVGEGKARALETSQDETLEARAEVALLNQQLKALGVQISELNNLLDDSADRDKAANAQIEALGKKLNMALASKVQELARYRSEFFGQLRKILGNRQDIQIVNDRFVFQSEVLFKSGSADLGDAGKLQLAKLSGSLLEISRNIPTDINWLLQVEGHTDSDAIHTTKFPSNWELSTARATSVVKYLIEQGIPANRLAAAGYGEFQPLDPRGDEIADRRNRRIELKLSQR